MKNVPVYVVAIRKTPTSKVHAWTFTNKRNAKSFQSKARKGGWISTNTIKKKRL